MKNHAEIVKKIKSSIAFISVINKGELRSGSGFVFSQSGIIVTCNHVVLEPFDKILVQFPDMDNDKLIEAKVTTRVIKHDIAILEYIEAKKREPIEAVQEDVEEGMPVIFSGYPLGIRTLTTHQGIISSIFNDLTGSKRYLIDGTVNSGNSGCPLMTIDGKLIGVVNATQREDPVLLENVSKMETGVLILQGIDLMEVYQALIKNLQLGIGYAVPCSYIKA